MTLRLPHRMTWVALAAAVLLAVVAVLAPHQLPVLVYKGAQVALFAVLAYVLDLLFFPYARPHEYFGPGHHMIGAMLMLRRAAVIVAVILGGSIGL